MVYVILKNKLQDNLTKDFYLHNAISLATRLHDALPDKYINAKHYIQEVKRVLQSKVGDHTFTRKMGLNIASMLLGIEHQRKFDCLMARLEDSPVLKEPFDRETRGRMVSYQKQALEGVDKFQPLGALSKKNTDLLGMYTSNKMPMVSRPRTDVRVERKRRSNNERREDPKRQPQKRVRRDGEKIEKRRFQKKDVEVKPKSDKGEKKAQISKVSKKHLQKIYQVAVSLCHI